MEELLYDFGDEEPIFDELTEAEKAEMESDTLAKWIDIYQWECME